MFGWPVIGLASDRVGSATGRDPFYTIRIDAVWPSSEGAEKVIIWPDTDLSRSPAIGQYYCNRVAWALHKQVHLLCVCSWRVWATRRFGFWVLVGPCWWARVGWAVGSVISFFIAARHDVFRSRFVGEGRFAGR